MSAAASVDRGPRPLGQRLGHVLNGLVPHGGDLEARPVRPGRRRSAAPSGVSVIRNTRSEPQPAHLVAHRPSLSRAEHDPLRQGFVDELGSIRCGSRCLDLPQHGDLVVGRPDGLCQVGGEPSAAIRSPRCTRRGCTPGCIAVMTSSHVSGSGRSRPRSVMTSLGPPPRRPSRWRSPGPSPKPIDERKSQRSTNARALWRMMTMTCPAEAAISGAPPAPGSRVRGAS